MSAVAEHSAVRPTVEQIVEHEVTFHGTGAGRLVDRLGAEGTPRQDVASLQSYEHTRTYARRRHKHAEHGAVREVMARSSGGAVGDGTWDLEGRLVCGLVYRAVDRSFTFGPRSIYFIVWGLDDVR